MAKDKKSSQANLIGRTALYGVLSVWGLMSSLLFLYLGLGYSVATLVSINIIGFPVLPAILGVIFLAIGFALLWLDFKNGRAIWKQWRRKQAISEEAQRVSRLMDEKAETDNISEKYQDENEAEGKTIS